MLKGGKFLPPFLLYLFTLFLKYINILINGNTKNNGG